MSICVAIVSILSTVARKGTKLFVAGVTDNCKPQYALGKIDPQTSEEEPVGTEASLLVLMLLKSYCKFYADCS